MTCCVPLLVPQVALETPPRGNYRFGSASAGCQDRAGCQASSSPPWPLTNQSHVSSLLPSIQQQPRSVRTVEGSSGHHPPTVMAAPQVAMPPSATQLQLQLQETRDVRFAQAFDASPQSVLSRLQEQQVRHVCVILAQADMP